MSGQGEGGAGRGSGKGRGTGGRRKPCLRLRWCPYGVLVEGFPLARAGDTRGCGVFGHECPTFTVAEDEVDDEVDDGRRPPARRGSGTATGATGTGAGDAPRAGAAASLRPSGRLPCEGSR